MKFNKLLILSAAIQGLLATGVTQSANAADDHSGGAAQTTPSEENLDMKARIEARKKEVEKEIAEEEQKKNGYYKEAGTYGTKRLTSRLLTR